MTLTTPERETLSIPLAPFSARDRPSSDIINTCVHCGLCLSSCPTYRETGLEMSSPRGRIYLMKAVDEGRIGMESEVFQEQMSQCLNCRACEAVCPSGVQYGAILEASRAQIEQARERGARDPAAPGALPPRPLWQRALRGAVFGALFKDMGLFRAFSASMRLYQRSGAQWIARKSGLLKLIGMADAERMLPPINARFTVPRGQIYPAEGERRYSVALLTGCIMSTAFAGVHEATIRVLQKNGCEVILPPGQGCCGALHTHGGDLDGGRDLARRNIAAFEALGVDAIVVNAAGCGSTLKEYHHLLHDDPLWYERAAAFSRKVKDVHEFLAGIEFNRAGLGRLDVQVTYQEPCHLAHAQRITVQPRTLLTAIPGLQLREMHESALCCGSAGVYNLTQPDMAARLGARKVDNALATGARVIATANPGCALQLAGELRRRGEDVQVRYIVELLDESYRRRAP
ncbi:MAG: heterodisulfide reductase-related iron-sulfur binding cluster [Oscillochloridaceae bacterium]|nr:heterodisulfide reductase-related iron-sulfur binding cluster [Chloroflexaceae bacterium]MDW8390564.1 heterodisulfide reductase-related iron-sulfur binding cluster [Oscillochloridaceae bacterium]